MNCAKLLILGAALFTAVSSAQAKLDPPTLRSPSNKERDVSIAPTLRISGQNGATAHTFEVTDANNRVVLRKKTAETKLTIAVEHGKTYYWRAIDHGRRSSDDSNWSSRWRFTTIDGPLIPRLLRPVSGASDLDASQEVFFKWSAVDGVYAYDVKLWPAPVTGTDKFATAIPGATKIGWFVEPGRTYRWCVRARYADGRTEPWSPVSTFSTRGPLVPPSLVLPANGAREVEPTTLLSWNQAPGAAGYEYMVFRGNSVDPKAFISGGKLTKESDSSAPPTFVADFPFTPGQTFTWTVRTLSTTTGSDWSAPSSFTTTATPSVLTRVLSPMDGKIDVALHNSGGGASTFDLDRSGHVFVTAQRVYDADHYLFEIYEGPTLNPERLKSAGSTAERSMDFVLNPLSKYTARCAAVVQGKQGPWSSSVTFITLRGAVLNLAVSEPSPGFVHAQWTPRKFALRYDVQVTNQKTGVQYSTQVRDPWFDLSVDRTVSYTLAVRPIAKDGVVGTDATVTFGPLK